MIKSKKKNIIILIAFISLLYIGYIHVDSLISWCQSVYISFNRTLIDENRYVLIFKGLGITIIISFVSIIVGSILGLLLYLMQKIDDSILNKISKIVVYILQGIPITVLLLLFFYVVFANINIDPVIVAIISFSIYFSAYMCEVYKGSYESINENQINSAYALGFTKFQTIKYIVFPQMLSFALPVFKNESVTLIKLTSICGYISVMELTKASDIIRNRTYEAFFPLILTAIIYFVLCYLFGKILDYFNSKINKNVSRKGIDNEK